MDLLCYVESFFIEKSDQEWIFGQPFLRLFFTIFDLGKDFIDEETDDENERVMQIGFATSVDLYAFQIVYYP